MILYFYLQCDHSTRFCNGLLLCGHKRFDGHHSIRLQNRTLFVQDLEKTLEPIFYLFKLRRQDGEAFGDFTARVGFKTLTEYSKSYISEEEARQLPQVFQTSCLMPPFIPDSDYIPKKTLLWWFENQHIPKKTCFGDLRIKTIVLSLWSPFAFKKKH